jgi:hypothetical protein
MSKEQLELLEQAKRRQQMIETYTHIQRTQGPDKAQEWYACWIKG